jgi:site-specific recombinase XerD
VLVENIEDRPQGSDIQGLSADLLEAARRRNLSGNSLTAYDRTWRQFLAWAATSSFDPRSLPFPTALEAYRFLGEGKNAASLKQIRAALSFAYKHWDLKNPFAKIEPPLQNGPQIRYLLLSDIRRLLDYLKARRQGYGSALAFHLTNALFQTACRFEELIQLIWIDCQRVGEEIVALRIKGKMFSGFQLVFLCELLTWQLLSKRFEFSGCAGPRTLGCGAP